MQQATEMVLKGCADKANVNKQQPMALQQLHDDDRRQQNEMRKIKYASKYEQWSQHTAL